MLSYDEGFANDKNEATPSDLKKRVLMLTYLIGREIGLIDLLQLARSKQKLSIQIYVIEKLTMKYEYSHYFKL